MGELHRSNMIFRRQLITAATAIVTVLSLCCLVATEAHTLSDAIVPEATSDTADLLVLADQYSDTADLLTDAASWEKRALAAEGSENKLKSELFGEQAEVTRLKDAALHPALGKPVGSTGRTPGSHVEPVESKPIHLVDGTIPLLTVNDKGYMSWTPYTLISVGGGPPVKVLVDTGSSVTALCPGTDIGSAVPENEYGCCQYGDTAPYSGWVGQYHTGSVVLGDQSKLVSDPTDMTVALMTSQNSALCSPDIKGIMGVDYGRGWKYAKPQGPITNLNGQLLLDSKGEPKTKWQGCSRTATEFKTSFDGTMMVAADEYKFAFIGVNKKNTGNPVMAFGITTTELLRSAKSVGQADFTSNTGNDNTWFSFSGDVHFALKNWKLCDDDESKCEYTSHLPTNGDTPTIIDSGTQQIVLPSAWEILTSDHFQHMEKTKTLPPSSTTLEITIGSAKLVLPFSELLEQQHIDLPQKGAATAQTPTIGFPAFWYYDFLFHIGGPKSSVGGTLSVFSRD